MLRIQDVSDLGERTTTTLHLITAAQDEEYRRTRLRQGDLVYSVVGSLGRCMEIGWDLAGANISRAFCVLGIPDAGLRAWVRQYLAGPQVAAWLARTATGNAQKVVNMEALSRLAIPIPPPKERDSIVEILEEWDTGLRRAEALRQTVATALDAYQRQHLHCPHGVRPDLPEGWRLVDLGSLGRVVSGGTPSTSNPRLWNGEIPWLTPAEITGLRTRYVRATDRSISEEGLRVSAAEILPAGSLIVCTRASVGEMAINTVPMATNQGFKSVVPNEHVSVEFLYYYMRANQHALQRLAAGSTFSEVSKTAFEGITVALPPLELQHQFAGLLSSLDDQITALRSLMDNLRLERQGLLSGLMSGHLRAPLRSVSSQVEEING